MASKFGMAGGIPERKVRPIWDAVDSRQFKNALKLSSALLSKYNRSPYAFALKALVVEKTGKADEALSLCLNAKDLLFANDAMLMDDLTLSTLQIVFQRLDHLDLATSCYEHACGKFPNNLELMMGLFNCYVREYSFVKQQQTAIKMYKIMGEERYLLWAVCSIQLQVLCGKGGEKLLTLAEGLIKKHMASHGLHETEALLVYISILEQQAKYSDALEVLSGKLGALLTVEADKLRIQGNLHARAGDYAAAANTFQRILELCPDDWECFLNYLGSLLEDDSNWSSGVAGDPIHPPKFVQCKLLHLSDEVFDSRISNASAFVRRIQTNTSSLRCPYLANIEIERRKHLYGKGNDETLIEALVQYFSRFGHLACVLPDVEMFLQVLSLDKRTDLLEKLQRSAGSLVAAPTKLLGQSITLFKIQEFLNMNSSSVNELSGSAVQMANLYCKNLLLSKDLDPQESTHGEELLSMICGVLIQLFWRTRHIGYFIEAIMVLEFGLTIRRFVSQYKILLLHLHSHLGALSLSYERFKSLDVKNILMETVLHHILPQMLVSPLWTDLSNLLKDYLSFMDDHLRESADLTFLAHRHRNYTKVIEFVQFKERLQQSNQYLVAKIEASILQLKQNANNIEEEEAVLESMKCGTQFLELSNEISSRTLSFNEDFHSRPWWTPTPEENYLLGPYQGIACCAKENVSKERASNVRRAIEKRSILPRMIYLSIQSAMASLKENIYANSSHSDTNLSLELKSLLERYAKILGFSLNDAIDVIVAVACDKKPPKDLDADVADWMNFAVFWNAWNLCSCDYELPNDDKCRLTSWRIVNSLLEKLILGKVRSLDYLISSSEGVLPIVVQLISEPFAWHVLVIQSFARTCVPSGKRKKKSGSSDQSIAPFFNAVRDSTDPLCYILEEIMKWLKEQINRTEDENLDVLWSSFQSKEQNDGPGNVFRILESLVSSSNETELGDQISQALQTWCSVEVVRRIISEQHKVLSEFLKICESKFKSLQTLKLRISQV